MHDGNLIEAVGRIPNVRQLATNYQSRLADVQRATEDQINLGRSEGDILTKDESELAD